MKIKKMRGPLGAMMFFSITINLPLFFLEFHVRILALNVCHRCYKRSKKAFKKALAHPEDHLERFLRPIQATRVTSEPFWTRQKRLEAFQISSKNFMT